MHDFSVWGTISSMAFDWPMGTILSLIMLVCVASLAAIFGWLIYMAADSWFRPLRRSKGKVIDKTYAAAHTQMMSVYNPGSKTSDLQTIYIPDDWRVYVEVDGRQDSISVSQEFYNRVTSGTPVSAEYVSGRFSGNLYLRTLAKI